jgi:hypothetical protein
MQRYQTTAFATPYMQKMHTNVKNCLFDVDYMAMQPWIFANETVCQINWKNKKSNAK